MQASPGRESEPATDNLPTPHDALFKVLLGHPDRAAEFLQMHLPKRIRKLLSDAPPVLLDGHYVDEMLRYSQSDLLFRVQLKSGGEAFLYVLFEHKSAPDFQTPLQLASYMIRIWRRQWEDSPGNRNALWPIIPLVVYHGRGEWTVPLSLFDMVDAGKGPLRAFVRSFSYLVTDLGHMPEDRLARDRGLLAGLLALIYAFRRRAALKALAKVLELLPDDGLLDIATLRYIVSVYDIERAAFENAARMAKPERWEALVGTIAEEWIKQGEARGLARGEARGRSATLARQLERRFGPLPPAARRRIDRATQPELDGWLDAVLNAPTLDAVFRDARER